MPKEKERKLDHFSQRLNERPQEGTNPVPLSSDVTHGLESLRTDIARIFQRAGCQVPLINGQFMLTKPGRGLTGDFVTPCGEFKKSKVKFKELIRAQQPGPCCQCVRSNVQLCTD